MNKPLQMELARYQTPEKLINRAALINAGDLVRNHTSYLDEISLYITHFNTIPNVIEMTNLDYIQVIDWITQKYPKELKNTHFTMMYSEKKSRLDYYDVFIVVFEDTMLYTNPTGHLKLFFVNTLKARVISMVEELKQFKKREVRTCQIHLLATSVMGVDLKALEATKPRLSIDDNYNEDFKEVHQIILKRLQKRNDKGLVLLHGKPGTGKTSYIRYLIHSLRKKVIFIPPNTAEVITSPNLMGILIDNPNSVLVIEDAERIIVDREREGGSPISALLNLTDGLLSDCLNVQVICSFNTDIEKVDSALLRKGRLIAKYDFKELTVEKANALTKKLGYSSTFTKPATLTAVYNQDERDFKDGKERPAIGFRTLEKSDLN